MGQAFSLWIPETSVSAGATVNKICEAMKISVPAVLPAEATVNGAIISAKRGENAIIAAGTDVFCNVKLRLFRELSVKILRSSKLTSLITEEAVGNSREYNIQTAVTEKSSLVVSSDGLFSAVSCEAGDGRVTIVPLDEERLSEIYEKGIPGLDSKPTAKDMLAKRLEEIIASGKKIAISDSGSSEALSAVIKSLVGDNDTFRFVRAKENITEDEAHALPRLARNAKETIKCDIGVAVGNISEKGTISVSVADSDRARVAEVHPVEGESEKHLMGVAVTTLCDMISEAISKGIKAPDKRPVVLSGKPLIIVAACIAVAVIACFIMGFTLMSNRKNNTEVVKNPQMYAESSEYGFSESDNPEERGEVSPIFSGEDESASDSYLESLRESIINLTAAVSGVSVSYNNTTYNGGGVKTGAAGNYTTSPAAYDFGDLLEGTVADETEKATREKHTLSVGKDDEETVLDDITSETESTTAATTRKKASSNSGKFVFTVYGWGHGVGMSQDGAKALARSGKTCNEILAHYYQGTVIKVDPNTPMYTVVPDRNGKGGMTLLEFLCKTVKQEIGDESPEEALKAQAVAAYTYAMYNGNFGAGQTMDSDYNYKGTRVERAVMDVLHITDESQQPHCKYISYNGKYINAVYCDSMAGTTASAGSVWGMPLAYLSGGVSSPEEVEISTVELSVSEVRNLILSYGISESSVDSNPAKWFNIVAHDGAYNNGIGYVNQIEVCGVGMSGNRFREKFMHYKLRSHCFTIQYVR